MYSGVPIIGQSKRHGVVGKSLIGSVGYVVSRLARLCTVPDRLQEQTALNRSGNTRRRMRFGIPRGRDILWRNSSPLLEFDD